jgi:CheY-like chemotaxis protein
MTAHHPVILIVEDEALVRLSAVGMLEDAGFRIIEAANGDEALELLETDSDIQLLFTDINMPGAICTAHLLRTVAIQHVDIALSRLIEPCDKGFGRRLSA